MLLVVLRSLELEGVLLAMGLNHDLSLTKLSNNRSRLLSANPSSARVFF